MIHLLRAADRVATPWKNGGGITTEVAAFPEGATLDSFGWRVSIAQVRQGGPFSVFPGIDRVLAVLSGRLRLAVEGRAQVEITPTSPPVAFPGDVATAGEPVDGPVVDLNVMTRRGQFTARMTRHRFAEPTTITFNAHVALVIPDATSDITVVHGSESVLVPAGSPITVEIVSA